MKILVVTSSYPQGPDDVAGCFVREWVEQLEARGHQLRVLTWRNGRAESLQQSDEADARLRRVPYAPPRFETLFYGAGAPENLREQPARALLAAPAAASMAAAISREIAEFRPDVLVGHWLVPAGLLVRAAGRLTGIAHLVVGHSGGVHLLDNLPRSVGRLLARFIASGPLTLPSLELAEKFGRLAPVASKGRVEILPMGFVGPDAPPPARQRRDWLCMGRLVDIKGVDLAIEAWCEADLDPQATLYVAGGGPRRPKLERLAEQCGHNVEFCGFVTGEDKRRLFERCGFALFCSKRLADGRHEGLPVSFLEASAHGVVPLCTAIPGLSTYLADAELQELQTRAVSEWSARIEALASVSTEERVRLASAQRTAVESLEWGRLAERWQLAIERARAAYSA